MKNSLLLALADLAQSTPLPTPLSQITQAAWDTRAITVSTIIIALAAVVNFIVAWLLWRTTVGYTKVTRDIFDASHRPYVGVVMVDYVRHHSPLQVELIGHIKNVGTVPARDVKIQHQLIMNGKAQSPSGLDTNFGVIFPGVEVQWRCCTSNDEEYKECLTANLEVRMTIDYAGLAGQSYRYEYQAMRERSRDVFAVLKTSAI